MIIDAIDLFMDIRREVEMDRQLALDYGIDLEQPEAPYIIIDDRMWAWIPKKKD